MNKLKVDIAIVGFQKAGTTSILKYLAQQEEIYSHPQKEMTYFSVKEEYEKGWEEAIKRYFSNYTAGKKLLIKHATLIRHEASIKRLHEHNPDAKIIICLRDPVQRAYSSYLMEKANGNQTQSFKEVIAEAFENNQKGISDWRYNVFVKLGEYVNYIDMLHQYFPKESMYVLKIEDFHQDKLNQFTQLCNWLGIEKPSITVVENQHNTYKVAKSGMLSKMLTNSLSEKSLVKKTFRKIIPLEKQAIFGDKIRELTKKKAIKEPLDSKTKEFLEKHYEPFQKGLTDKYLL
ncbi:sulfotransferase [Marivirga tractuosa]|uniref:sulfotransferase family protein n=1 Tax=Marivirga tractuosa TaxID=1006 RepID=UPI0035CF08C7